MPAEPRAKIAVVLFNLGAPDRLSAVAPFLLNLFRDPAILRVPPPVRAVLSRAIAGARRRPARENYKLLGGASPLLDLTRDQAAALRHALPGLDVRCFIAMRYWHPFAEAAARAVWAWRPDQVVLLPLYPHFSTTTTGSSLADWHEAAARVGLVAATHTVCCYATGPGYLDAVATLAWDGYQAARATLPRNVPLRVLFSAHGLPASIVSAGDPYQWQIEQTVAGILARANLPSIDWAICYQSRATPQRWLEPGTVAELERAARDRVAVLVVPVAFVSEHSETLVELDAEYRHIAERSGVPGYFRVPTPGTDAAFIAALAGIVRHAVQSTPGIRSHAGERLCPVRFNGCPCGPASAG